MKALILLAMIAGCTPINATRQPAPMYPIDAPLTFPVCSPPIANRYADGLNDPFFKGYAHDVKITACI